MDRHRHTHGVEPICEVLQIAPSGYRRHAACQRKPELRCARARTDDILMPQIQQVWQSNMQVYGADKVWHQMSREGVKVARCTVERLMEAFGVARGTPGQGGTHNGPRQSIAMPTGQGQSAIQGRPSEPAVGIGLHVRVNLAGLAIRGLRD